MYLQFLLGLLSLELSGIAYLKEYPIVAAVLLAVSLGIWFGVEGLELIGDLDIDFLDD